VAGAQFSDPLAGDIECDDRNAGSGECGRDRQADITETDDSDAAIVISRTAI